MENPASAPIAGYSGPADNELQQYWLDVSWRQLQADVPSLVARIESGELDAATVGDTVTAAARRVLRNPEGFESESGQIDDYRESWKRSDSTEDVYFTAAELRRLQSALATSGGWVGSLKYS